MYIYAIISNIYAILIPFRICIYLDFFQIENFLSNLSFLVLYPIRVRLFYFQTLFHISAFSLQMFHGFRCSTDIYYFPSLCSIFPYFCVKTSVFVANNLLYINILAIIHTTPVTHTPTPRFFDFSQPPRSFPNFFLFFSTVFFLYKTTLQYVKIIAFSKIHFSTEISHFCEISIYFSRIEYLHFLNIG